MGEENAPGAGGPMQNGMVGLRSRPFAIAVFVLILNVSPSDLVDLRTQLPYCDAIDTDQTMEK